MLKAKPFLVRFEASTRKNGRQWAVKQGPRWRFAREVSILTSTLTGQDGTIAGVGVVRCIERGHIVITA